MVQALLWCRHCSGAGSAVVQALLCKSGLRQHTYQERFHSCLQTVGYVSTLGVTGAPNSGGGGRGCSNFFTFYAIKILLFRVSTLSD